MKKLAFLILFIAVLILSTTTTAQEIQISASLQNDSIIVGEQTQISIKANFPKDAKIIFPEYKDTICDKIFLIKDIEAKIDSTGKFRKDYLITAFDTGTNIINPIQILIIKDSDTLTQSTNPLSIKVKPYILIDTIPRDTIYSNTNGFIVFGKDGFKEQIEQYIPDSIKQTMTTDSLNMLREEVKKQLMQQFSVQVMQQTGMTNQTQLDSIANSDSHRLFIVNKNIEESFYVYGSVDSVFVQEFQQVKVNDPLYTLFEIEDINEDLYNTPFTMAEFWYDIKSFFAKYWWIIVIIIAIGIAIYVIYCKRHNKKLPSFIKIKPKRPAHEIALEELERIRNEKIWIRGQVKEFYVQITDVIRVYISNRYGIDAEQMTSSEIIAMLNSTGNVNSEDSLKLRKTLELADAVKFAKYQTLQGDNDLSLRYCFEFVESTKEIIAENIKDTKLDAEIQIEENQQQPEEEKINR